MKSYQIACWLSVSAFVVTAAPVAIAEEAPKDNKGLAVGKAAIVDLGPEIAGMDGWQLRQRLFTIERADPYDYEFRCVRPALS